MQRSSEEMRKQRDPSAGARARVAARREGRKWLSCAIAANPGHLGVTRPHRSELLPAQRSGLNGSVSLSWWDTTTRGHHARLLPITSMLIELMAAPLPDAWRRHAVTEA